MSFRLRLVVLSTATVIAAAYTWSLVVDPLCTVYRSGHRHGRHETGRMGLHSSDPVSLATHH